MEKYFDEIFSKCSKIGKPDLWYKAREYVMSWLQPLDGDGIGPGSDDHVHIVVDSIKEEMLAVVRQICLIAHYPNFKEENGSNRTVITFCLDSVDKKDELEKGFFGNLFEKIHFPLDIEFEFTEKDIKVFENQKKNNTNKNEHITIIKIADVEPFFKSYTQPAEGIDISKGMLVNMVYNTGATIDNLPACDNDNVPRYSTALNVFCYKLKWEEIEKKWKSGAKLQDDGSYRELDIKNQLSSIFCADCFESRLKGILDTRNKTVNEYLLTDFETVMEKIRDQDTINALVRCEHARWNVERLILGFEPLKKEELYEIECLFGKARKDKIKSLKNNFHHIDLCSNKDLRRINPGDVKYDYFLMLAMPQIVLSSIR